MGILVRLVIRLFLLMVFPTLFFVYLFALVIEKKLKVLKGLTEKGFLGAALPGQDTLKKLESGAKDFMAMRVDTLAARVGEVLRQRQEEIEKKNRYRKSEKKPTSKKAVLEASRTSVNTLAKNNTPVGRAPASWRTANSPVNLPQRPIVVRSSQGGGAGNVIVFLFVLAVWIGGVVLFFGLS